MLFVSTSDNSNTLYSKEFNQHYHNIEEGALYESTTKYVVPSFRILQNLKHNNSLHILDICFGLGYNTFATILYMQKNNIHNPITIYSPEFDTELIKSLVNFKYPKEFDEIEEFDEIINSLSNKFYYKNNNIEIIIKNYDARKYLKELIKDKVVIDIVYQDAFSSEANPLLWTKEYFEDISRLSDKNMILCTYSIATPIRIGLYQSGFEIYHTKYLTKSGKYKHMTIASKKEISIHHNDKIDMLKKIDNTPNPYPLFDKLL